MKNQVLHDLYSDFYFCQGNEFIRCHMSSKQYACKYVAKQFKETVAPIVHNKLYLQNTSIVIVFSIFLIPHAYRNFTAKVILNNLRSIDHSGHKITAINSKIFFSTVPLRS